MGKRGDGGVAGGSEEGWGRGEEEKGEKKVEKWKVS